MNADRDSRVVTWCVVNYGTAEQVCEFANELRKECSQSGEAVELRLAVCDNSPSPNVKLDALPHGSSLAHRPDNPGYLPGAISAALMSNNNGDRSDGASWVIVSNTDIEVPAELWTWLANAEVDGCFAPQVYCARRDSYLNPHVISRPSLRWFITRWLATRNSVGLSLMLRLHARRSSRDSNIANIAKSEEGVYACHGTIWIFAKSAFEVVADELDDCPLYAEELSVAEVLLARRERIRIIPDVVVRHEPHLATGQQTPAVRARRWRDAYSYILRRRMRGIAPTRRRAVV